MTDFKIPPNISIIIREAELRNSPDINKAIRFLIKKLRKEDEFQKFKKKIRHFYKKNKLCI